MIDIDKIIDNKSKEVRMEKENESIQEKEIEDKTEYEKVVNEKDNFIDDEKDLQRALTERKENNSALMSNIETPNFTPEIDKNKDLVDQAGDVINIMAAKQSSEDKAFMQDVAKNFQEGVLTDQETKNLKKQRLLEQEYFLKWQDVLQFAFIKSAHGLLFMQIMTVIAMFIYVPLRLIGMLVKSIGTLGDFINDIFNSVFGGKGKYLRDKNGNVIIDPTTNKPYFEKQGYNLFAKVLFGILIGGLALALVFLLIYMFTGFNIFTALRNLIAGV